MLATEAVLAHVKCHLAFAATTGREGMDACPLYLRGIEATSDGSTIELRSPDPKIREELRARIRTHVESPAAVSTLPEAR